jgi:predicted transcriptional regulator
MPKWLNNPRPKKKNGKTTRKRPKQLGFMSLAVRSLFSYLAIRKRVKSRTLHWKRTNAETGKLLRDSLIEVDRINSIASDLRQTLSDIRDDLENEERERRLIQERYDAMKMVLDELTAAQTANIERENLRAATYAAKRTFTERPSRDEDFD